MDIVLSSCNDDRNDGRIQRLGNNQKKIVRRLSRISCCLAETIAEIQHFLRRVLTHSEGNKKRKGKREDKRRQEKTREEKRREEKKR